MKYTDIIGISILCSSSTKRLYYKNLYNPIIHQLVIIDQNFILHHPSYFLLDLAIFFIEIWLLT